MSLDINNNYRGTLYGRDRLGYTTPDADASEPLRPFLPVPYPAPWLPGKRLDEGHPVGAQVVLSSHSIVGLDKSGALVPAGLIAGTQNSSQIATIDNDATNTAAHAGGVVTLTLPDAKVDVTGIVSGTNSAPATSPHVDNGGDASYAAGDTIKILTSGVPNLDGSYVLLSATHTATPSWVLTVAESASITPGQFTGGTLRNTRGLYCAVQYGQNDVGFARNVATGNPVAAAGEYEVLAAPSDGVQGDIIVFPNGNVISVLTADVTFGQGCNVIPNGVARPVGYVVRNVFQFLGGVNLISATNGIFYTLESMVPLQFRVHNYMHEMGTAIQTHFVLRMPWIGASPAALQAFATADGISGYVQTDFGRSFVHATGGTAGNPYALNGLSVVASRLGCGQDAGNYSFYNSNVNGFDEICGRVLGVESLYPIRDFANRVRTQFERATEAVGPFTTKTPSIGQLGGSATRGMDYMVNLTNDGILRLASDQNKTIRPEYATYVYVHFLAR
jgi:hypothetical protein